MKEENVKHYGCVTHSPIDEKECDNPYIYHFSAPDDSATGIQIPLRPFDAPSGVSVEEFDRDLADQDPLPGWLELIAPDYLIGTFTYNRKVGDCRVFDLEAEALKPEIEIP